MSELATALFGGSFNPPHLGHLGVCRHVLEGEPGPLWILPAFVHPFGKALAPFEDRLRMCELLVDGLGDARARVTVSCVEREVPSGTGWTIDTLQLLRERHPGRPFRLVLGSDLLDERDRWKDFDRVERMAPPIWIPRRGFEGANASLAGEPFLDDIRSVDIRSRVAGGQPVDALVGEAVARYIVDRGLYREVP